MSEPVEMVWEDCSQGTTPRPFETKQVRALWAFFGFDVQEFDRWLASVKVDAWEEGAYAALEEEGYECIKFDFVSETNPYREEQA
jgi:hypothetical protein